MIEEAFLNTMDTAMANEELVIVDDLHLVRNVVEACNYRITSELPLIRNLSVNAAHVHAPRVMRPVALTLNY